MHTVHVNIISDHTFMKNYICKFVYIAIKPIYKVLVVRSEVLSIVGNIKPLHETFLSSQLEIK